MSSILIWMIILTAGDFSCILADEMGTPIHLMNATALISLALAAIGLRETIALDKAGALQSEVSASTARYMGLIWTWGALALFVTYYFVLPAWREWPVFSGAFAILAAICLMFAAAMSNDAEKAADDKTLLKLGRILTIVQFAGTLVAMAGLLIDPDKRYLDASRLDWAATNIFFFGAMALAAVSATALIYTRDRSA